MATPRVWLYYGYKKQGIFHIITSCIEMISNWFVPKNFATAMRAEYKTSCIESLYSETKGI